MKLSLIFLPSPFSPISSHLALIIIALSTIIFIVIVLVLFADQRMDINSILNPQLDVRQQSSNPPSVDLVFEKVPGKTHLFVFDKNDYTGINMLAVFAGKNYESIVYGGKTVIYVKGRSNKVIDPATGESTRVKLVALTPTLVELQSGGLIINSNGQPIEKSILDTVYSTSLYIKKDT